MNTVELFNSDSLSTDIKGKTVRGGAAVMIAQGLTFLLHLIAIPILSRLLLPADFGLVAMATVMTGFASMFVDAGLSMATVHQAKITAQQVNNLFWLATGLGTATALTAIVASPLIAWFYGEPRLQLIVVVLSASFVFSGMTIQHQALLQRAMRYRELSMRRVVGTAAGLGSGILWAYFFHNYWALVIMPVVMAATQMVLIWISTGWWPGRYQRGAGVRKMVHFGANLTGYHFLNYFARNLDNVLVGWQLGPVALGLYSRAYQLMMMPAMKVNGPLTTVVVPALCRLRENPERYRSFYRRVINFLASLTTPPAVFMAVAAHEVVYVVLGPNWVDAGPLLQALSFAALCAATNVAAGWVYQSCGHVGRLLRWAIFSTLVTIVAMVIGLRWGALGVAMGISISQLALKIPGFWVASKDTPLRLRDFLTAASYPTIVSIAAALPVLFLKAEHLPGGIPVEQQPFYLLIVKLSLFIFLLALFEITLPAGRRHAATIYDVYKTLRKKRSLESV